MAGLIGKKIGMTSIFDGAGKNTACTVIEAGPCVVTQMRTCEKDGYEAIQLGFGDKKVKHTGKPLQGHFAKVGITPKKKLAEFHGFEQELKPGDVVSVNILKEGEWVDVVGISKGKGFQGVVKRHGFGGIGQQTHGQHDRQRAPGSVGGSSYPSRVFKGMRMAGRMGGNRVSALNLKLLKVIPEKNLLIVKGAVPGANGGYVLIKK